MTGTRERSSALWCKPRPIDDSRTTTVRSVRLTESSSQGRVTCAVVLSLSPEPERRWISTPGGKITVGVWRPLRYRTRCAPVLKTVNQCANVGARVMLPVCFEVNTHVNKRTGGDWTQQTTLCCSHLLAVIKGLLTKDMHACIGLQQDYMIPEQRQHRASCILQK